MAYTKEYTTTNINEMVVDVFGTVLYATMSWIDLLVLLVIVGVALSVVMGILFKVSRVLGLG